MLRLSRTATLGQFCRRRTACKGFSHISRPHQARIIAQAQASGAPAASQPPKPHPGLATTAWAQEKLEQEYPVLAQDLKTDVVVVGAGINGLSTAYNLVKRGAKVVVLERGVIGGGQTGKTTAHLMMWNDDYYHLLEQHFGTEKARMVADSHRLSIDFMEKVVQEEGIECKFQKVDGYLFPHDNSEEAHQKLDLELVASEKLGVPGVKKVNLGGGPEVGGIRKAVLYPGCADFQPLQYLKGLAKAITRLGGTIYEGSHVTQFEGTVKVSNSNGQFFVKAPNVVLATNSPINHNLAVHARQSAYRSYVIGMKIPKGAVKKAQFWDTAEPYHYIRTEEDAEGSGNDILIVGGDDHPAGQNEDQYVDNWQRLESYTRARWTKLADAEVVYRWTGQVYEPIDFLGLYGKDPINVENVVGDTTVWVSTGNSGQGMTGGTISGMVLGSEIMGESHPWTTIYSPSRVPPVSLMTVESLAEEAMQNIKGFGDRVSKGLLTSLDSLEPGSGGIVQRGVHKAAVYKDEQGRAHMHDAVCPHLGCLVTWNPNAQAFDCPCHGSQFDPYGKLVNGPAKADLGELA